MRLPCTCTLTMAGEQLCPTAMSRADPLLVGSAGILQNVIKPGKEIGMNSYLGHSFFFTPPNDPKTRLKELTVTADEVLYTYEPQPGSPSYAAFAKDKDKQRFLREEREFMAKYKAETGVFWRAVYPRWATSLALRLPRHIHLWLFLLLAICTGASPSGSCGQRTR